MGSSQTIDTKYGRARASALAVGILLAWSAGCEKPPAQDSPSVSADAGVAVEADAGTEEAVQPPASSEDVAAPTPVVAGDPEIPLNEAVVGTPPMAAEYIAESAPPAPVLEEAPPSPAHGHVWVPGYWWWSRPYHRYVWVGGAWRNPPPDQIWTAGSWERSAPERYLWRPGFWGPRGYVPSGVIEVAPPLPRVEVVGASPGTGFVWTPGYYGYRSAAYVWTAGSWLRPPVQGLAWVEPRYVGLRGRYYFQPGRWDHLPEFRGTVYRPEIDARPGIVLRPVPVAAAVVVTQTRYVTASVRAVSLGATRTSAGGYVAHTPHDDHPGREERASHEDHGTHDDHPSQNDHPSHEDHGSHDEHGQHTSGPSEKRPDSKH